MTSRWVTSVTLDLLKNCRMTLYVVKTSLRFVRNGVHGHRLGSTHLWGPLPKHTWQLVMSSRRWTMRPHRQEIARVLQFTELYL